MTWLFCPLCANELEVTKDQSGEVVPTCPNGHFRHYGNPKPTVGTFVEHDGTFLILRRAHEPEKGQWNLPGGFMEQGETAEQTAIREVKEETGLDVEPVEYLGSFASTYGNPDEHTVGFSFICKVVGGKFSLAPESSEAAWVTAADLPEMALADDNAATQALKQRYL